MLSLVRGKTCHWEVSDIWLDDSGVIVERGKHLIRAVVRLLGHHKIKDCTRADDEKKQIQRWLPVHRNTY